MASNKRTGRNEAMASSSSSSSSSSLSSSRQAAAATSRSASTSVPASSSSSQQPAGKTPGSHLDLTYSVVHNVDAAAPELAALLASVFADVPIFVNLFMPPADDTSDETYRRALTWLFERRLHLLHNIDGPLVCARDANGKAVAVVGATTPGRKALVPVMFMSGMGTWPCRWGLPSFLRGLFLDAALDGPASDQWELVMMGVAKEYQGRGVGSALMKLLLSEVVRLSAPGAKIHLTTQLHINVRFYEKLGFHLHHQQTLHSPWFGFRPTASWSMQQVLPVDRHDAS